METQVLKDIKEYKYKHFMGLDSKKVFCLILTALLGGLLYYLESNFILYTGIFKYIISVVFLAIGFIEIEDMSGVELIKQIIKSNKNKRYNYNKITTINIEKYLKEQEQEKKKLAKEEMKEAKKNRKEKK